MLAPTPTGGIPTVFFKIKADSKASQPQNVPAALPAKANLEQTDLAQLGGAGMIAKQYYTVLPDPSGTKLAIQLVNLGGAALAEGIYQGVVTLAQTPVAIVLVVVVPP